MKQTTSGHSVFIHVLDKGALLTLRESTGYRRRYDAARHAAKCAAEYAARYDGATALKHVGDRWTIHHANGITFAQFDVTL